MVLRVRPRACCVRARACAGVARLPAPTRARGARLPACPGQIDLTDDYVVMALFGDGGWEDSMTRLTARDDDGRLVDVVLDADAFRDLISVLE